LDDPESSDSLDAGEAERRLAKSDDIDHTADKLHQISNIKPGWHNR
jgi:hypothetical protein